MYQFNGTSDALQLPAVAGLGDYTIACRFSATTGSLADPDGRAVFGADDGPNAPDRNLSSYQAGNGLGVASCFARVAGTGIEQDPAQASEGGLHWLVIRRAGTTVTWWLDGVRVATATVGPGTFTLPTPTFGAYGLPGSTVAYFEGLIDRASIWSRAWTLTEIDAYLSSSDITAFADQSGLVYDLPLDTDTVERHSGATVTGTATHYTGTAPAAATPPPAPAVTARIRAGWPQISPDRGLITFLVERVAVNAQGGHDDAPVALVESASLVVDGTTVPLVDPLYSASTYDNVVSFPLNPAPQVWIIDEADATLTGTWNAYDGDGNFAAVFYGTKIRYTVNPADTAAYPFTGLTPGSYVLSVVPALNEAAFTTIAAYSCDDGVLAAQVLHHDQTAPNVPQEDRLDLGIRWHDLGTVTVSGTTLTVTLSNAAGAGQMGADAVRLELVQAPGVPAGATTITLDAPDGWAGVADGDVAGASGLAVPVATVADWFGYDPAAVSSTPMRVGRNRGAPTDATGARVTANLLYSSFGVEWLGGTPTFDVNGNVTGLGTATGMAITFAPGDGASDHVSGRGFNLVPPGTWKVRYRGTASTPAPTIVDTLNRGLFAATPGSSTVDAASGKTVQPIAIALADIFPINPVAIRVQFDFPAGMTVADIPTDIDLFDPFTASDWGKVVHPLIYAREHGASTGIVGDRWLNPLNINAHGKARYADFSAPDRPYFMGPDHTVVVDIASIGPVTDADNGGTSPLFTSMDGVAVVKVTTTTPHGLATNNAVSFQLTNYGPTDTAGGTVNLAQSPVAGWVEVLSATEFLCTSGTTGSAANNTNAPGPITLTGPFSFGTGTITATFGDVEMSPKKIVQIENELDHIPWLLVPHGMVEDAEIDAYADGVLAVLDPGRKIRLEYTNEPWNPGPAFGWLDIQSRRSVGGASPSGTVMAEYARRAILVHRRFRARWAAAGRDPLDVIRVMGSQAVNDGPTQQILDRCIHDGATASDPLFDELAIDTYIFNKPRLVEAYAASITPPFERLDEAGIVALLGVNQKYTHWQAYIDPHLAKLQNAYPNVFNGIKPVSYEGSYTDIVLAASDAARRVEKSFRAMRHPNMRPCYLARLQMLDGRGITLYTKFLDDGDNSLGQGTAWVSRPIYYEGDGAGDGSDGKFDNRTDYFRYDSVVTVQGGAEEQYAALALTASGATTYTLVTAGTGTIGTAQTVTVTLNGPGTAVVTLASAQGTFDDATLSFSSSAGPLTAQFTPSAVGTATITGTNDAGLTNPAPATISVADRPATAYTLVTAGTGTVGVAQTVTVTLDHPGTATITPASTHGTFSPPTLSFGSSAGPLTTQFTPSVAGTATITATNNASLANPAAATVAVADLPATTYTLVTSPTGAAGAPQAILVTLDHPGTVTVILSATQGAFEDATAVFANTAGPVTVFYTPATGGTATISGTNNGGLANPASVAITIEEASPVGLFSFESQHVKVDASASGANTVVAAVPGKSIWVDNYILVGAGAVDVTWKDSAGAVDLSGPMTIAAAGGVIAGQTSYPRGQFHTARGAALVLDLSAAVAVGGHLTYWVQ